MTPRSKNFLILGLIIGIFVAFAVAGRLLIHPEDMGRVNRGTLIVPHLQTNDLGLQRPDGSSWTAKDMAGKWSLLYVAGEQCQRACRNGLFYLMHRLRQSLGRDNERLRLILVHTQPASPELEAFIAEKTPELVELSAEPATITAALQPAFKDAAVDPLHHIYLVAPDGQVFMWYPTHADMEAILREADNIHSDLKRTLKGSLIG